jgi:hypothetical protein
LALQHRELVVKSEGLLGGVGDVSDGLVIGDAGAECGQPAAACRSRSASTVSAMLRHVAGSIAIYQVRDRWR